MGIAKRGGQCLAGIYLNVRELNIKICIKYWRSVSDKLIETKKPPEKLLYASGGHKTSPDSSFHHCFHQFTYWLEWYLVIPRELTGPITSGILGFPVSPDLYNSFDTLLFALIT